MYKFIVGNQMHLKRNARHRLDIEGLLMSLMGPSILFISSVSIIFVLLDYDPSLQLFPSSIAHHPGIIILRLIMNFWMLLDSMTNLGVAHLTITTLILHTKSIFRHLPTYRKPTNIERERPWLERIVDMAQNASAAKAAHGDLSTVDRSVEIKGAAAEASIEKDDRGHSHNQSAEAEDAEDATLRVFKRCNGIQLFVLTSYFFTVMNKNLDIVLLFTLFPGFILDVALNFAVVALYGRIPLVLYIYACLVAVIVPTIIVSELPQAGKSYESSVDVLHHWKAGMVSRKTLKFKRVRAYRAVGYTMGGFFTFKQGTTSTFAQAVMDYTINSVLSVS
jgi:hypothetical protein